MLERIPSAMPRPLAPQPTGFTQRFWDELAAGRFVVVECRKCSRRQFPPRSVCPSCHSDDVDWVSTDGRGVLHASTRIHTAGGPFACMTPYSVGVVDLDAGTRVLTRLLHDASSLPVGARLRLVIVDHTDGPLFAARADER